MSHNVLDYTVILLLFSCSQKAIEAALQARQWNKAIQILDLQEPSESVNYYKQIAQHYAGTHEYDLAKQFFIKADMAQEAVDMYIKVDRYSYSHTCSTHNTHEIFT